MPAPTRTPSPAGTAPAPALPPTLRLGAVHLTVTSVDRSVAWYQRALGLRAHRHDATYAELGDGVEATVVLHEDARARPAGRHAGLYHYALLFPSREELARVGLRLAATQTPVDGASDHRTHEAIYLPDPDGNGIELAADRPRDAWPEDLGYANGPAPLDFGALLGTVTGEAPRPDVGEGLRMGHLHLHVGDVEQALAFYAGVLGFEPQADLGTAAFVSAGGYHHHLGVNVWRGRGVGPAPAGTVGLRHWTVQLPTDSDVAGARERAEAAGAPVAGVEGGFRVEDAWGTAVAFVSTTATGLRGEAVVATDRPSPYLLQLAKHFRHKLDVTFDERHAVIPFAMGVVEAHAGADALTLRAHAHTPADLSRTQEVAGRHLERFGARDELRVRWT